MPYVMLLCVLLIPFVIGIIKFYGIKLFISVVSLLLFNFSLIYFNRVYKMKQLMSLFENESWISSFIDQNIYKFGFLIDRENLFIQCGCYIYFNTQEPLSWMSYENDSIICRDFLVNKINENKKLNFKVSSGFLLNCIYNEENKKELHARKKYVKEETILLEEQVSQIKQQSI